VLPFTDVSNDPAQDYFADGVTENLTTELSRLHNSFVIARNTAFTFKGKNVDAKAIGKELSVRYVLEGSVQRDANRVRVNAQLIDAESGAHLWADRFDEDVVDLFKLQDEVGRAPRPYASSRAGERRGPAQPARSLTKSRRHRFDDARFGASQPTPHESQSLRGPRLIRASVDSRSNQCRRARGRGLRGCDGLRARWSDQSTELYARAMQRANQALLLIPDQATAHYAKARLILFKEKPDDAAAANQAIAEARARLRADPSLAVAYWPMAVGDDSSAIMNRRSRISNMP
jgi:adenylate cyclase